MRLAPQPIRFDEYPERFQFPRYRLDDLETRHVSKEKERGGGGSSFRGVSRGWFGGSSSSSSGGYRAPAPASASAPKSGGSDSSSSWGRPTISKPPSAPAPKSPRPATGSKPAGPPVSKPGQKPGWKLPKLPKPKSGAGPSPAPGWKPKIGQSPKVPSVPGRPKTPGIKPHHDYPHVPAIGNNGGHKIHHGSNKLGGCNIKCRNTVLITFGTLALVGLLCLLAICIFRRKKRSIRRDVEMVRQHGKRSSSNNSGRKWPGRGRKDSRISEDGMELMTHTARGIPFSMSRSSILEPQQAHRQDQAVSAHDIGIAVSFQQPQMSRPERNISPFDMAMPAVDAIPRTHNPARNTSPYDPSLNYMLPVAQLHSPNQSQSSSYVRDPSFISTLRSASLKSRASSADFGRSRSPVIKTARSGTVLRCPSPIQMIAGFHGWSTKLPPLQRRGARRDSDRPDMSGSRSLGVNTASSTTFVVGGDSDESDIETFRDDEVEEGSRGMRSMPSEQLIAGKRTEKGLCDDESDKEHSRGRTSMRTGHGSTRKRRDERPREGKGYVDLSHADSGVGDSDRNVSDQAGERCPQSPQSINAAHFVGPVDHHVPGLWV